MGDSLAPFGSSGSVCREFYDRFKLGRERIPENMVAFLLNHHSSRSKIDEWLKTAVDGNGSSRSNNTNPNTSSHISQTSKNYGKCNIKSTQARELGNSYFKKKDLVKSLQHYNEAILHAPVTLGEDDPVAVNFTSDDRTSLAIAFANRSAVYTELGEKFLDKALEDATLSLKYGYPERLKHKILLREATIHVLKHNIEKSEECLHAMTKMCVCQCKNGKEKEIRPSACEIHSGINNKKVAELAKKIEILKTNSSNLEKQKDQKRDVFYLGTTFIESKDYENASSDVKIMTSDLLGRHVVALNDIKEDAIIFKEEPYASVLLPDFYRTHCHHCHIELISYEDMPYFFPCSRCSQVMFCSEKCSVEAKLYHNVECGFLDFFYSMGIAHLALRTILTACTENILDCVKNHKLLSSCNYINIFCKGDNNYRRVYSLMDHISDMYEEDLFQYSLTAALLTEFLSTTTNFLKDLTKNEQLKVGGVLLRHICQLICNAHAITDILPGNRNDTVYTVVEEYQKRIATAIFPAASIMNHSCDPNITFHFEQGKSLLVKAQSKIEKGDNVYNCYGPHFRRMPRQERQDILLQQYFFNCNCDKCTDELKQNISFVDQFNAFKCTNCKNPVVIDMQSVCLGCGVVQDVNLSRKMYNVVSDLFSKGEFLLKNNHNIDETIEVFTSCYSTAEKILFKYNSQFGQLCDVLARCYLIKGNILEAKKFLKKSLKYVEARFGSKSQEYIRELNKYKNAC